MLLVTAELPMLALIFVVGRHADAHRFQPLLQVHLVGRNHHPPAGHLVADQLRLELFAAGDKFHFGRDLAGTGGFKLGHGALRLLG